MIFDVSKKKKVSQTQKPVFRLAERNSRSTWADHDGISSIFLRSKHGTVSNERSFRIPSAFRNLETRLACLIALPCPYIKEPEHRSNFSSRNAASSLDDSRRWRTSNDNQPLQHRCFRFVKARVARDVDQIVYDSVCASIFYLSLIIY